MKNIPTEEVKAVAETPNILPLLMTQKLNTGRVVSDGNGKPSPLLPHVVEKPIRSLVHVPISMLNHEESIASSTQVHWGFVRHN